MSYIDRIDAREWIKKNHPNNGLFRVYWKDIEGPYDGGVTFNLTEGKKLRWEWFYKDGQKDGVSKGWWPDGKLKHQWSWKNGIADGTWIHWNNDGLKFCEENYKDGKLNGTRTTWYENGQKESDGTYKEGCRDGNWTEWYSSGQRKSLGTYNNELENGLWTYWSPDGNDVSKLVIKNGQPWEGRYIVWGENGERKLERFYENGIN